MSSCRSSNDGNYRYPNPESDFEKIVQHEIGFDQNIADKLRLDVTLFYKDGKNLTNLGVQTGGRDDEQFGTSSNPITRIYPDRNNPNAEGIGSTAFFDINTNGGTLEARGLDISLESLFLRNVQWAAGQLYTFHPPGDLSTEPNNRRWEPRTSTNMRLSKLINLTGALRAELFMDVINLFNQNHLNGNVSIHITTNEKRDYFDGFSDL